MNKHRSDDSPGADRKSEDRSEAREPRRKEGAARKLGRNRRGGARVHANAGEKGAVDSSPPPMESLPLDDRLRLREEFFRTAGIDPRQFLQAFDHVPGLFYFVKDARSRTMLNTREYAQLLGQRSDEAIVGKPPGEYLAREGRIENLPHLGEVGKAAAYIRANLGERFLLSDVAERVGVSERHLQRLFHQRVGMTIQQFVIHSRVHAAAYELTHSRRPMGEIALMFGFSDQAAFTNTFRKMTGLAPRAYRGRHSRSLL